MPFNPVANFNQGLLSGQNIQKSQRENQIRGLQNVLSGQMGQGGFDPSSSVEMQQLTALAPEQGARSLAVFQNLDKSRQKAFFQDAREGRKLLEAKDGEGFLDLISDRLENVEKLGGDPSDVQSVLQSFNSGDIEGTLNQLRMVEQTGIEEGFLSDPAMRAAKLANQLDGKSAKMRQIESLIEMAEEDPKGETIKGKAAHIELGLISKVSKTAAERIAENKELSANIVKLAADKAGATESAKLSAQLIHKPQITKAVKLAEKQAIERGDVLTSLGRSQAALPGLYTAVGELKELAKIATSTFGGRLFDEAIKQSGFGTSKGGTARAKFIAIVNNQVLPLLKETFGAAFTKEEGESLKATMGDPDASPEEKAVQLDAFIAQKVSDIETKQRQLEQSTEAQGQLSDEDLLKKYGG